MKFRGRRNMEAFLAFSCAFIFAINVLSSCYCVSVNSERVSFRFNQAINLSSKSLVRYQILEHEGDLIVSGNETRTIEDCEYRLIGNVTVKDNATLIVRNAVFNQTGKNVPVTIVVKNRASFYITNVTLMITQNVDSNILVEDEAKMCIANSNVENPNHRVIIWAEDNSLIHIENSIMRRAHESVEHCAIVSDGHSEIHIKNSTLERETVWGSSKVFIERATLADALRIFGNSTVKVSDSTIKYVTADGSPSVYIRSSTIMSSPYIRTGGNSDIWLLHMTVQEVWAGGNATVNLVDASVEVLHMYEKATLFVGWDLPLFGPVVFPPALAFFIQLIVLILLVAGVTIMLFVLIKKLRRRSLSKPREHNQFITCLH